MIITQKLNENSKKYSRFLVEVIDKKIISPKELAYIGATLIASGYFIINKEEIACVETILLTSDMDMCALLLDDIKGTSNSPLRILRNMVLDCLILDRDIYEKN